MSTAEGRFLGFLVRSGAQVLPVRLSRTPGQLAGMCVVQGATRLGISK